VDYLPVTLAVVVRLAFMALGVWVLVRGFRTYRRRRREPDSPEKRSFIRSWHTLGCGAAVFLVSALVMVLRHQWHGPQWIHELAAAGMFVGAGTALVGGAWVGWTSIDTRNSRGSV
jgi:hypothetical protein